MLTKRIRYYAYISATFLRSFPFSFLGLLSILAEGVALRVLWPGDLRRGIRIVDPNPETRGAFIEAVAEALALIETNDHMRFARLRREITTIINLPVDRCMEYSRALRTCRVNFPYYPFAHDRENSAILLACHLIHAASRGYLESRKVLQNRNKQRWKALCYQEERRFARRLGVDLGPSWGSQRDKSQ
jgi:hypothetical protein